MQKQLTTDQLTIADWVKGLAAIRERDFTLENVQDYILATPSARRRSTNICFSPRAITRAISFSRTSSSSA